MPPSRGSGVSTQVVTIQWDVSNAPQVIGGIQQVERAMQSMMQTGDVMARRGVSVGAIPQLDPARLREMQQYTQLLRESGIEIRRVGQNYEYFDVRQRMVGGQRVPINQQINPQQAQQQIDQHLGRVRANMNRAFEQTERATGRPMPRITAEQQYGSTEQQRAQRQAETNPPQRTMWQEMIDALGVRRGGGEGEGGRGGTDMDFGHIYSSFRRAAFFGTTPDSGFFLRFFTSMFPRAAAGALAIPGMFGLGVEGMIQSSQAFSTQTAATSNIAQFARGGGGADLSRATVELTRQMQTLAQTWGVTNDEMLRMVQPLAQRGISAPGDIRNILGQSLAIQRQTGLAPDLSTNLAITLQRQFGQTAEQSRITMEQLRVASDATGASLETTAQSLVTLSQQLPSLATMTPQFISGLAAVQGISGRAGVSAADIMGNLLTAQGGQAIGLSAFLGITPEQLAQDQANRGGGFADLVRRTQAVINRVPNAGPPGTRRNVQMEMLQQLIGPIGGRSMGETLDLFQSMNPEQISQLMVQANQAANGVTSDSANAAYQHTLQVQRNTVSPGRGFQLFREQLGRVFVEQETGAINGPGTGIPGIGPLLGLSAGVLNAPGALYAGVLAGLGTALYGAPSMQAAGQQQGDTAPPLRVAFDPATVQIVDSRGQQIGTTTLTPTVNGSITQPTPTNMQDTGPDRIGTWTRGRG